MRVRTLLAAALAAFACTATLQAPAAVADDDIRVMFDCGIYPEHRTTARSEILARSQSWIDARVPYSQSNCHSNSYGNYRTDCSGYVSMVWGLRSSHTTLTLPNVSHEIARSDLRLGDALNNRDHVALFIRWADAAKTRPIVREQAGPDGAPTVQREWSQATAANYTPIRYDKIVENLGGNADMNADGKGDILAVAGDKLRYYRGDGTGNVHWGYEAGAGWSAIGEMDMGDVDGDGRGDVIALAGGKYRYHRGDGTGNIHWVGEYGTGWDVLSKMALADVTGDGKADMVGVAGDKLRFYRGDGTGNFHWGYETGVGWSALSHLEAGDINSDGKADMVGIVGDRLRFYIGDGTGNFHWGGEYDGSWSVVTKLAITDIDGDGRGDLRAVAGDKLRNYLGDGTGNFHWGSEIGEGWSTLFRFAA